MNTPIISIIVACYNAEGFLDRCVESILNQTIGQKNMEIILVDDCSSDSTRLMLQNYSDQYDCIKIIFNHENLRQGGSQNKALEIATGKYIGFVDNDDWIEPDMYRDMIEAAEKNDCDIVNILHVRDSRTGFLSENEIATGEDDEIYEIAGDQDRAEMIAGGQIKIGTWNCIFKRSVQTEYKLLFPEHLIYEDIYWGALWHLYFKKIYVMKKRYYHYFVRENSTVLNKNDELHKDFFQVQKQLEELRRRGAFFFFFQALEFDYLMNYYVMGVKMLSLRFSSFPCDLFREMKKDINIKFPDWRKNHYIDLNTTEFQKLLLNFLSVDMSEDEMEQFATFTKQYYGG